jgi:CRP-like cAMP-binding protein
MSTSNGIPERRTFAKGTVVFREGDRGAEAYLVQKGAVRIFKTVHGKRITLGVCKPTQVFGEMALLDDGPRMAAAEASEETVVLVLPKSNFQTLMDSAAPGLTTLIQSLIGTMRVMGDDLASARAQLMELGG